MPSAAKHGETEEFSLVLGGPLYQFCLRTRLARPPLKLLHRRIAALILLAWLPLLVLTTIAGTVIHGVRIPFLLDLDVHARLLVSLTLLVLAEPFVHQLLATTVEQLRTRDLIGAEDRERFDKIVADTMRLRNSVLPEVAALIIALIGGNWLGREHNAGPVDAWYGVSNAQGVQMSVAGYGIR